MIKLKYRYLGFAAVAVLIAMIGVATVSGDSILQQIRSTEGGVPNTLTYSGYLTDEKGAPINDTRSLTFAMYDRERGGRLLWRETHQSVKIEKGLFSVELGNEQSISRGLSVSPVWLGITIGDGRELTPRKKLTAAPFAIRAQEALTAVTADDAKRLNGLAADSFLTETDVSGFLTEGDIADFVTSQELAGLQSSSDEVCNLEGRLRAQFFDFDISDDCAPPARELTFNGFPLPIMDFALNRAGLPTLVVKSGNIAVLVCTDITCANFSYSEVSNTLMSGIASLTFTLNGMPRIAYTTPEQDAIKLIECSEVDCQSSVLRTITNDTSRRYRHVDVEVAPDGSLLFAYQSTNGTQFGPGFEASLLTAHCTNASCTNITRTEHQTSGFSGGPVFTGGGTGSFPVIQFLSNGLPRIAYTWNFNTRLMIANCTNVRCSASDLDDREIVINGPKDIATGSDGERPLIIYLGTNGINIHETCRRLDLCSSSSMRDESVNVNFDGLTPLGTDYKAPQIEMLEDDVPMFIYYLEDVGLVHGRCVDATCRETTGSVVLDDAAGTFDPNTPAVRLVVDPSTGDRLMTSGWFYIRCAGRCGFD